MSLWKQSIDTFIQDSANPIFKYNMIQELKTDIVLTAPVSKDDDIISVSAGHGFTAGSTIVIFSNSRVEQQIVKSVSTNDITLYMPIPYDIEIEDAVIIRGIKNLNVDGSETPIDFKFLLRNAIVPIDIKFVRIFATHTAEGDYSKFMGIAALTNGLWFRQDNGRVVNLGNYRNNTDFLENGWKVDFPAKAPAGVYATECFIDLKETFGDIIRINPREDCYLYGQIRDAIDTLLSLNISVIGSYTSGE